MLGMDSAAHHSRRRRGVHPRHQGRTPQSRRAGHGLRRPGTRAQVPRLRLPRPAGGCQRSSSGPVWWRRISAPSPSASWAPAWQRRRLRVAALRRADKNTRTQLLHEASSLVPEQRLAKHDLPAAIAQDERALNPDVWPTTRARLAKACPGLDGDHRCGPARPRSRKHRCRCSGDGRRHPPALQPLRAQSRVLPEGRRAPAGGLTRSPAGQHHCERLGFSVITENSHALSYTSAHGAQRTASRPQSRVHRPFR